MNKNENKTGICLKSKASKYSINVQGDWISNMGLAWINPQNKMIYKLMCISLHIFLLHSCTFPQDEISLNLIKLYVFHIQFYNFVVLINKEQNKKKPKPTKNVAVS